MFAAYHSRKHQSPISKTNPSQQQHALSFKPTQKRPFKSLEAEFLAFKTWQEFIFSTMPNGYCFKGGQVGIRSLRINDGTDAKAVEEAQEMLEDFEPSLWIQFDLKQQQQHAVAVATAGKFKQPRKSVAYESTLETNKNLELELCGKLDSFKGKGLGYLSWTSLSGSLSGRQRKGKDTAKKRGDVRDLFHHGTEKAEPSESNRKSSSSSTTSTLKQAPKSSCAAAAEEGAIFGNSLQKVNELAGVYDFKYELVVPSFLQTLCENISKVPTSPRNEAEHSFGFYVSELEFHHRHAHNLSHITPETSLALIRHFLTCLKTPLLAPASYVPLLSVYSLFAKDYKFKHLTPQIPLQGLSIVSFCRSKGVYLDLQKSAAYPTRPISRLVAALRSFIVVGLADIHARHLFLYLMFWIHALFVKDGNDLARVKQGVRRLLGRDVDCLIDMKQGSGDVDCSLIDKQVSGDVDCCLIDMKQFSTFPRRHYQQLIQTAVRQPARMSSTKSTLLVDILDERPVWLLQTDEETGQIVVDVISCCALYINEICH